jgi:hypothetical protein
MKMQAMPDTRKATKRRLRCIHRKRDAKPSPRRDFLAPAVIPTAIGGIIPMG